MPAAAEDLCTGGVWAHWGCWVSESTSGAPSRQNGSTGTFPRGGCVTCHHVCRASAGAVGACWEVSRAVFCLWLHKSHFLNELLSKRVFSQPKGPINYSAFLQNEKKSVSLKRIGVSHRSILFSSLCCRDQ